MKLSYLAEAGYGTEPTVDQVSDLYWEVYEDRKHPPEITVLKPGLYETGTTIRIYVHNQDDRRGLETAKQFMKNENLPYTKIIEAEMSGQNDSGVDGLIVTFAYMERDYR